MFRGYAVTHALWLSIFRIGNFIQQNIYKNRIKEKEIKIHVILSGLKLQCKRQSCIMKTLNKMQFRKGFAFIKGGYMTQGIKQKMTRRITQLLTMLVSALLISQLFYMNTSAADKEQDEDRPVSRVIRVAFPEAPGISEIDEYGNHKGLMVDYLNEIAKYTDWEYKYIETSSEDVVNEFMDGKYDLMGGMFYSPSLAEYFAYPEYSMGSSRAILLCRKDDKDIKSYNLKSLNGKTIGVYEQAKAKIEYLNEFLHQNNLDCTLKYYTHEEMEDEENLYRFLRNGEVDLLLGNDGDRDEAFRTVTSFEAQPYYLVTQIRNKEIIKEMNEALEAIQDADPEFAANKYDENFPDVKSADIQLTEEELAYLKEKEKITVAVVRMWHPFYCVENKTNEHNGILPDLLEKMSEYLGIPFTYVYAETYEEALELVHDDEVDILGAYLDSDEDAFEEGLALTKAYTNLNSIIIKNKSVKYPDQGMTGGIIAGRTMPDDISVENIKYYDTTSEGLQAVDKGEIDFVYGLSANLDQEMQNHLYSNIVPVSRVNNNTAVSIAMERPVDKMLLGILDKAINSISIKDMNTIVDKNLISMGSSSLTLSELVYANPVAFISILCGFVLIILIGVIMGARSKVKRTVMEGELARAEAKSRAKSDFLSKMSHEIRTPMNAIIGLSDLACMKEEIPDSVGENLQKIRSSSQYLLSLINDILDMSKIENGKMEIMPGEFSMKDIAGKLMQMIEPQTEQKDIRFLSSFEIHTDKLTGDAVRLRQVLLNLLANAVKFTPGGGTITFRIKETEKQGDKAGYLFEVSDTGVGIAKENQDRIFKSFEQLGNNMAKSEGTGLGLPISSYIVEAMGGRLQLESEPGKGSRFFFEIFFPVGRGKERPDNVTIDEAEAFAGIRILLAEDNDLNAEIAKELLEIRGAQVERAADGQEAVDRFENSSPGWYQAILMDIRMPKKDGLEATREIRESNHPDSRIIPIIAMTANTFKEDVEASKEAGMSAFVPKPVDIRYLWEILQTQMRKTDDDASV